MRASKYKLLNDSEWLREKYITDGLSTEQIKELVGCASCASVAKYLRNHNIDVRTKSAGHRMNRVDDGFIFCKDVLEGCLLGDGFMRSSKPNSPDSFPFFSKRNIHYDHVKFVGDSIFKSNSERRIKDMPNNTTLGNGRIFYLSTLTHPELMDMYRTWYPPSNNFKKIIPESIEVTENLLLHWFLDDGYSYYYTRLQKYTYRRVEFACMGFEKEELEKLCHKVFNKFGITMFVRVHKRKGVILGTGCEVHVKQGDISRFYDIIGPPPVPSLAYKWK